MADYTQPPYGLPFSMPPPPPHQFQHTAPDVQSNAQNTVVDPRQASITESFQFNAGLPGLNLHSLTPNSQQSQYQYWPPPPPPAQSQSPFGAIPFPPFLAQSGFPIPPPPPPGQNFFPPVPPLPLQNAPTYTRIDNQPAPSVPPQQQPRAVVHSRLMNMTDSDKEDGEVSEGDGGSYSPAVNSRPVTEAPRSIPQGMPDIKTKNGAHQQHLEGPISQSTGQTYPALPSLRKHHTGTTEVAVAVDHRPSSSSHQQHTPPRNVANLSQKRDDARRFVRLLHENNIGYPVLVTEGLDPQLLRDLYQSLNLPSAPAIAPIPSPTAKTTPASKPSTANGQPASDHIASAKPQANGQFAPQKPTTAVKTNNPPAKSAASPIDRKDYIARLQAAKLGKQQVAPKVTPPQETLPAPVILSSTIAKIPQPSTAIMVEKGSNGKLPISEAERQRKTDLIRQKLELLKAKQKVSTPAPATPIPSTLDVVPPSKFAPPTVQQTESALQSSLQSTPASMPAPSFPRLPGLFMNSTPGSSPLVQPTQPLTTSAQTASLSVVRKRPVASDFDETTTPLNSAPPYTRPFGQSPHEHDNESMIIEVSDDDSGGSDMDLDEEPTPPPPQPPLTSSPNFGAQGFRSLPPLSDLPSRSGSLRPASSAISTPPAVRTPSGFDQNDLARKEKEILDMKQKIAELSRKQKMTVAKKEAATPSPAPSKLQIGARPSPANPASKSFTSPVSAGLAEASRAYSKAISASAGTPDASRSWKRQRRAEIESSLQTLNIGLESGMARLSQLEKEMAELKARTLKDEEDKKRLVEELESYGIDTEGMGDEELQAQKYSIEQQKETELDSQAQNADMTASGHANSVPDTESVVNISNSTQELPQPAQAVPGLEAPSTRLDVEAASTTLAAMHLPVPSSIHQEAEVTFENIVDLKSPSQPDAHQVVEEKAPSPTPIAFAKAIGLRNGQDTATPVDDSEDFYSPEPAVSTNTGEVANKVEPTQAADKSPSEEGEVEMSESSPSAGEEEEEEYEPEEPVVTVAPTVSSNQDKEVPTAPPSLVSTSSEGEHYEPPDADEIMQDAQTVSILPSPSNDTPLEEEQGAMDISMSSSDRPDSAQQSPSESPGNASISLNHAQASSIAVTDDLAPELQSEAVSAIQDSTTQPPYTADDAKDDTQFTPYESPLRMFKSYRYHPNYPQEVPGGYLSMTYSHLIDPERPLCRFESVGGTCNDASCESQHFRDMSISGEKLLVQLGTANPGKTSEERQRWNDGLRQVLKELRNNNIKDPNGIAAEISKYRRDYFNDDTRVVNL